MDSRPSSAPSDADAGTPPDADGIDRKRLLDEFDAALREDASLSAGEREDILRNYQHALATTPVQLGPPNLKDLHADFAETIQRLAELQVIDSSDSEQMVRKLTDALRPLEDESFEVSQEYARRVREDGAEDAWTWLQAETQAPAKAAFPVSPASPASSTAARTPRRRRR